MHGNHVVERISCAGGYSRTPKLANSFMTFMIQTCAPQSMVHARMLHAKMASALNAKPEFESILRWPFQLQRTPS